MLVDLSIAITNKLTYLFTYLQLDEGSDGHNIKTDFLTIFYTQDQGSDTGSGKECNGALV